ncbi:hypothetical protein P389DRAFT_168733 [Cystobasidium minutum MCA 4210]|uniref:uncharacterized protein n=1 Tax=Cystobasidium minutum MCA 4210 TaxID=1397322 RepID=UPI0034CD9E67|eukprot:jgi/Rhomi1/168733/fgenesh1_kg.3_\
MSARKTHSPSNRSEDTSGFGALPSLSPIVLEATLDRSQQSTAGNLARRRVEEEPRHRPAGSHAAEDMHMKHKRFAQDSSVEQSHSDKESKGKQDLHSFSSPSVDPERLQVPQEASHRDQTLGRGAPASSPDLGEMNWKLAVHKSPVHTPPRSVSSASLVNQATPAPAQTRGLQPVPVDIKPASASASEKSGAHSAEHKSRSPSDRSAHNGPVGKAVIPEQTHEALSPSPRATPSLPRPSILRTSSYIGTPLQQTNPKKSVTFVKDVPLFYEASTSSAQTSNRLEPVAAPQGGHSDSSTPLPLRSRQAKQVKQEEGLDSETGSSDSSDSEDSDFDAKDQPKSSPIPSPGNLDLHEPSDGPRARLGRPGRAPSPTHDAPLNAPETTHKHHRHGLPSEFYEAPKRQPGKHLSDAPVVANPYRTTVHDDESDEDAVPSHKTATRPIRQPQQAIGTARRHRNSEQREEPDQYPVNPRPMVTHVVQEAPQRSKVALRPDRDRVQFETGSQAPLHQPFEKKFQPVPQANVIFDYITNSMCAGLRYPSSGLVMPYLADEPIEKYTLGCSSVTMALQSSRGSSVYKNLRNLVWRFHLDLEDLNKRRRYHWLPMAEHCRVLMARMITDLRKEYVFRDRWERGRYKHILGDEDGSEPGTIFYMFKVSLPWIRLGRRYVFEAHRELQNISEKSSEAIQATGTEYTYVPAVLFDQRKVVDSIWRIDAYFESLAKDTENIEKLLRLALYRLEKDVVQQLLRKGGNSNSYTAADLDKDVKLRSDLTAWFDRFIANILRQWEKSLSYSAYEESLKRFRNYDRSWEEEGPNFGLLRSMFCLGICLPREYRTKLVNWRFVDNDPREKDENKLAIEEASDDEGDATGRRAKVSRSRRLLSKTLQVVERISDKFAPKENAPEEASQASSDEDGAGRITQNLAVRHVPPAIVVQPSPQTGGGGRRMQHDIPASPFQRNSAITADTTRAPLEGDMLLQHVREILGHIDDDMYREKCLEVVEGLMGMTAEGASLPTIIELLPLFKMPKIPREKKSKSYEEWNYLEKFIRLLASGGFTKRELWQIYLNALEDWGGEYEDLTHAREQLNILCQSEAFQASLDKPMNWHR